MSATPQESWVALLEDGELVQIMLERAGQNRLVGDIYLGRVDAVLPGIQAAFVDIGTEKASFLHASDLVRDNRSPEEGNGNNGHRRPESHVPIQDCVTKGQTLLVQVSKEPIGTKGRA